MGAWRADAGWTIRAGARRFPALCGCSSTDTTWPDPGRVERGRNTASAARSLRGVRWHLILRAGRAGAPSKVPFRLDRHRPIFCTLHPRIWDLIGLDQLGKRYGEVVTTYWLSTAGAEGSWRDPNGNGFRRLRVRNAAQYLVRPDGYIAFRSARPTSSHSSHI